MKISSLIIISLLFTVFVSCNSGSSETKSSVKMEDVFNELNSDLKNLPGDSHSGNVALKQGIVKEVLNADRYTYLELEQEDGSTYWIAISKQAIEVGEKITFDEGILKHNFESKEFNRMFETIYLVSRYQRFRKKSGGQNSTFSPKEVVVKSKTDEQNSQQQSQASSAPEGSTMISSIYANPVEYQNKEITIHGLVVKVNYNIMGKNWVHIQNSDNKGQDFTLTTNDQVMEGEEVTFSGTIFLDKDFGAGYRYDVIMENARRK